MIPCQSIKFSILEHDSDSSVSMAAIYYICPIATVPTNKQLLGEKRMCARKDSRTEIVVRVYMDGQTDGHG